MKRDDRLSPECVDVTNIAAVLELPAEHPWRWHAESCPRCRSLVASYVAFVEGEPAEGSDLERVRGLLDARIRADASRWKPSRSSVRTFWWQALLRPVPLLAAGLVVIAAAVFWTTREPEQSSLRESTTPAQAFALNPAELAADGNILLSWTPMAGADAYQARLYGPDFGEIYRSPNTTATSLTVERAALPPNQTPRLDLTWRVFALSQGDVIATSPPGSIRTP
jgi:hypothetical protein